MKDDDIIKAFEEDLYDSLSEKEESEHDSFVDSIQSNNEDRADSFERGQASGFWLGYKSRDKEVSEFEKKLKVANNDLRQYKKHVNKLMERYNVLDARDHKIEIQHHWFKNLIEWHKEAIGVNDEDFHADNNS